GSVNWIAFVVPGVRAELCFDAATLRALDSPAHTRSEVHDGRLTLSCEPAMALPQLLRLSDAQGTEHRIVLLSQAQADACSRQHIAGRDRLLLCADALHVEGDNAIVLSRGTADVQAWPADDLGAGPDFARWVQPQSRVDTLPLHWRVMHDSQQAPLRRDGPPIAWRGRAVPLAPDEAAYEAGLQLLLEPQADCPPDTRVMLSLDYIGDAARLYADGVLVDDQFADGEPWLIGLHRFVRADGDWPTFDLHIVPADLDLPIFLEDSARRRLAAAAPQSAALLSAEVGLWHRARLHFRHNETPAWLD
ncbi:hypothetical protein, partial [Aquabacterium sp.]|uniref:hypothetical protein n=1 Tax=Aquabacterium sp. TaxID=1872578 RepID=UPI002C4FA24E